MSAAWRSYVLRDGRLGLLRTRQVFDGIKRIPHPEEAAKQLSRRTHRTDPADLQFFHTLSGVPGLNRARQDAPFLPVTGPSQARFLRVDQTRLEDGDEIFVHAKILRAGRLGSRQRLDRLP